MPIKVLVVDDSAIVRQTLVQELSKDPEIEVIGTAADPFFARDKITSLNPDVITLDIEMPRMDGLTFLKKLMKHHPIPVIIVSSLSTEGSAIALEAIQSGAIEVMCKPGVGYSIADMSVELREKIKSAVCAKMHLTNIDQSKINVTKNAILSKPLDKIVVLGASTGGTQAIETVLRSYPENAPATVIVQHMPAGFTKAFAKRLNQFCSVDVFEAENLQTVETGQVLIAPGNYHTLIKTSESRCYVEVKQGPLIGRHRPSVDVLFKSAAESLGARAIGVLLTGMGTDGAAGMLKLKEAGAINLAQDEASSVVYGMPRAAVENGSVDFTLPLDQISQKIFKIVEGD